MTDRRRILVVGVGGQGAITAAKFMGDAALAAGMPVLVGQLHGMSQRGGNVECQVLIGPGHSSHIGNGEADVVIGLEPLETLRALPRMSRHTRVVVNLGQIVPFFLAQQGLNYPPVEDLLKDIRQVARQVFEVDGAALVRQVGESRTLNVVLLGAATGLDLLPLGAAALLAAIEKGSPRRYRELNRRAFELGLEAGGSHVRTVVPPGM